MTFEAEPEFSAVVLFNLVKKIINAQRVFKTAARSDFFFEDIKQKQWQMHFQVV